MLKRRPASLQIVTWNVNGIRTRKQEVEELLDERQPDVVALQETKIRSMQALSFQGYEVYRYDFNAGRRARGGVALLVKKDVDHHCIGVQDVDIDAIKIQINMEREPIQVTSVYLAGNTDYFREDIVELLQGNQAQILIGDLNAKRQEWNCVRNNQRGASLLEDTHDMDAIVIGPQEPTRLGIGVPEVLDIAILKHVVQRYSIRTLNYGTSDHDPVILELGEGQEQSYHFKQKTNWRRFQNITQELIKVPTINNAVELNQAAKNLERQILEAFNQSTRKTMRVTTKHNYAPLPPWIKEILTEQRSMRRRYKRTQDEEDRRILNRHSQILKEAIKEHKNTEWRMKLEALEAKDKSLWWMKKALLTERSKIPPLQGPNGIVYTVEDKAEVLADAVESNCRENNHPDEDNEFVRRIQETARQIRRMEGNMTPFRPTTPKEVKDIIKATILKKAPGKDGINNRMLKNIGRKGAAAIVSLANAMMRLTQFPGPGKRQRS